MNAEELKKLDTADELILAAKQGLFTSDDLKILKYHLDMALSLFSII